MEISVSQPTVVNASDAKISQSTSSATAAVNQSVTDTAFSQNENQFNELTSTLLDTSGKFSQDEQLQAYTTLQKMAVTAQLRGMDADSQKLYEKASMQSEIGKKVSNLQQQEVQTLISAQRSGGAAGAAQAKLNFFDNLSSFDKQVQFNTYGDPVNFSGNKRFANIDDYRANLSANAQLANYIQDAQSKGVSAGADSKLASLLKLADAKTSDYNSWTAKVLSLFGNTSTPEDKLDLSPQAQKIVGDLPSGKGGTSLHAYQPGSIASERA
ncbi:hypothetical protein [Asticcacaulis benevestitus]|uniref:DUF1217 domain-containing protein n=1 Tax=Asticcacaulis benevestitus DSM 16100 = ATCC BAA-896 TaxID=1121022 RepID=V4PW07_9CAUL|nr:hypothetical protein [Asticcacaulis benevestitus]ESQ92551.1 hypothetical protein ABENE_07900 [Asticcacaulis benevestitus DSM 16100 = ATCC BAA-896]